MKNRFLIANCFLGLLLGFVFYFLSDNNLYITNWLYSILGCDKTLISTDIIPLHIIRIYGLDFIWAYSMWFGIVLVSYGLNYKIFVASIITILCGIVLEILQGIQLVSGTGDILDVVAELIGVLVAIIVFLFRSRKDVNYNE